MKNVTTSEKDISRLFHSNGYADTTSKKKLINLRNCIELAAALIYMDIADLFRKN